MLETELKIANLGEAELARLRKLEEQFGTTIIAYKPRSPYAELNDMQLRELQALEQELGVVLLAYRPSEVAVGS